jgi:hypothetical protein
MKLSMRALGAAASALALVATACTSVLGVEPLPSATCNGAAGTDDCSSCYDVECCSELTDCSNNAACTAIVDCAGQCSAGGGFDSCLAACGAMSPSGVDAFNALYSCSSACTAACNSN